MPNTVKVKKSKRSGDVWREQNYQVTVMVRSPKSIDEAEAVEDGYDFMEWVSRHEAKMHNSYCSIIEVAEIGPKRLPGKFLNRFQINRRRDEVSDSNSK